MITRDNKVDTKSLKQKWLAVGIILVFITACFFPLSSTQTIHQIYDPSAMRLDGHILFGPLRNNTTYLVKSDGEITHTWSSNFTPGVMVRWLGDMKILRTIRVGEEGPGGGAGGGVQIIQRNGTIEWDFRYNTNGRLSHHDVLPLYNGNILMIAWETKKWNEVIAAGRNLTLGSNLGMMPDHIIEVQPLGPSTGVILWEWHVWDHLIQDYDPTKENYGVVADHPELVDINYGISEVVDWMHTNSIDYNEQYDQIMISVRHFNELWVIDHSTTTEEAAGHSGGNSGKGGDLLYRWGNPQAYDRGTADDQKFFMQHDATWIDSDCPGAGHILVFNNGVGRPTGEFSTVEEIIPPVNENGEYYLEPGSAYGPNEQTWIYTADPPTSFYDEILSGAKRLPSGNTLISDGVAGRIFEVSPEGETVWYYDIGGPVFKVEYVPNAEPPENETHPDLDCLGSLSGTNIKPGETINGSFQVQNIGAPHSTLDWKVVSVPDWGTWSFTPISGESLTPEDGPVTIQVSVVVPNEKNTNFEGSIRIENQDNTTDFDLVFVYLKTQLNQGLYFQHVFQRIFQQFPSAFLILRHLMGC